MMEMRLFARFAREVLGTLSWLGGAVAAHIKPLTFDFLRLRQSLDHRDRA